MSNVVNLVLVKKLICDNPRTVLHDLVDPLAMPYSLGSLFARQYGETLTLVGLLIAGDTDKQVDVREGLLGLFKLAHVAKPRVSN